MVFSNYLPIDFRHTESVVGILLAVSDMGKEVAKKKGVDRGRDELQPAIYRTKRSCMILLFYTGIL